MSSLPNYDAWKLVSPLEREEENDAEDQEDREAWEDQADEDLERGKDTGL